MITTLGLVSRSRIETIVTWCGITFKRRLNWKKDDLFLKKHYLDLFLKKHDCLKCYLTKCSLLWSVCQRGSKFQNVWISFLILFVFCSEFCANPCSCFTTQSSVDIITIWEQYQNDFDEFQQNLPPGSFRTEHLSILFILPFWK